ncbi:MAG: ABC transporter permease [Streptosporangiaceae bacterium]|nr:ABC transporter permease [Streptosporangiaceae bacterium]MBV9857239.1 ABC transporter permease [Streptosporangiaceae bacterium]
MTWYLIRRAGQALAVVIGVLILTFIMIHMVPGTAARSVLGLRATASRIAIFNATYGLDQPLWRQFGSYLDQVLHGDLGTSYILQQPVSSLIAQRLPRDALLLGLSTALALLIGLPLGIYQAVRRNGVGDYLLSGVSFTLYSMPSFFFGIMLVAVFSVQLHILPPEAPQATSVGGMLADPRALVLPVLTLALINVATYSRYMRSSAIDTLAQDYLRVVRAKGLPERLVLFRHVLRNSVLPIVTIVGLTLPQVVAGAVVTEEVFNYPGMGLLFYQASTSHDFPILLGCTLIVGVAAVAGNLAADVAYGMLDPRIRHGGA